MKLALELIVRGEIDASYLEEDSLTKALAKFKSEKKDIISNIIKMANQIQSKTIETNNFKAFEELVVKNLELQYPLLKVEAELVNSPYHRMMIDNLESYAFNLGVKGIKKENYILVQEVDGIALVHHLDERVKGHIKFLDTQKLYQNQYQE